MEEIGEDQNLPVDYTPDEQQDEDDWYTPDEQQDEDDWSGEWEQQAKVYTVGNDTETTKGLIVRGDKLFGTRYFEYKATTNLFDLLGLEDECNDPKFIKWLMDKKAFSVKSVLPEASYEFEYYGYGENGAKPFRRFNTIGEAIDGQEHITAITEIREYYDQYRKEELNKIMKKAGIATAVGVSLIAIITGLALGLKRKGHDMVYDSKTKWTKSQKAPVRLWTDLQEASGEVLILIGDHVYLVIGGVLIYLYKRRLG